MKIVVLDGHAVNPGDLNWGFLDEFGDVTVYERTPEELVAERIGDAEIILINKIGDMFRLVIDAYIRTAKSIITKIFACGTFFLTIIKHINSPFCKTFSY